MAIYKSKKPTKDGRQYFFRIKYKDIFGITHDYSSQKYKTSKETTTEEARYRIKVQEQKTNTSNITFGQAFEEYIFYKSKNIKPQTISRIKSLYKHLNILNDTKINNINVNMYKKMLHNLEQNDFSVNQKNKILSLFKNVILYSCKRYNTSNSILNFVEMFKDKNKLKKEMLFFTYDEYKQFDNVIDDFEYHVFLKYYTF